MLLSGGTSVEQNRPCCNYTTLERSGMQVYNGGTIWYALPAPLARWVPEVFECERLKCTRGTSANVLCGEQRCDFVHFSGSYISILNQGGTDEDYPRRSPGGSTVVT